MMITMCGEELWPCDDDDDEDDEDDYDGVEVSGKCHHVGVWSCHARSPNSARAHSCKYKYNRKTGTNKIERQTQIQYKHK